MSLGSVCADARPGGEGPRRRRRGLLTRAAVTFALAGGLCGVNAAAAAAAGPDPQGTIYVSDYATSAIDVFAPGSTGNVAPERVISGADTGIAGPGDVKVDANGDIWVSDFNSDAITEYAPGASGDATPICTIQGPNTGLDENDDMSLLPDGTVIVGNFSDSTYGTGSVEVFAPGACGNVAPVETISGPNTGLDVVDGVGSDADGTIYADSTEGDAIEVFPPGANGNVAPERSISGPDTGLSSPDDVIVGFSGQLVVTDGNNSVTVYAPGASGDAVPVQDISGPATDLTDADDAAVDTAGDIFVSNFDTQGVVEFASGATGDVAPIANLTGANTTFSEPEGVAVAGPPVTVSATVTTSVSSSQIGVGDPVYDTATVAGGTDSPTGQIVFKLFGPSDPTCSAAPAYTSGPVTVTGDGSYQSPSFDPSAPGTYSWVAVYSGDQNNSPITTACGDPSETVTVASGGPTGTQITTSLTGGGGSGGSITVAPGTSVVDSSLLSGSNAGSATGSVTYSVYSDANCSQLVSGPDQESITTAGSMPDSQAVLLSSPGTYYWQATYSGDAANAGSSSACGSEVETVSQPVSPEPTSLSTSILAGNGAFGPAGTPLSDQASLAGANVASASGTVTYDLWSDADCTVPAVASQTVSVSDGVVPASSPVVLPEGLYYYTVSYSGDALNDPSYSGCRNEGYVVLGSARFGADVGVQIELQPASPESAGSDFTVCVTVTNFGPKAAKNIVAGLLLGKGLTVVDPAGATVFGRLLIWKPGTFYAGESSTYSVTVEATKSGTATVTDGALSLGTIDPNYHNNFASEGLTINGADHVVGHAIRDRAGSVFLARLRAVGRELAKRSR